MVSYIEGKVTHDGRRRAPQLLFGRNYRKGFPWIRVGLGLMILYAAGSAAYRRRTYVSPQERFMKKIRVEPYGVMGNQMSLQGTLRREAREPDESVVITDPADLMTIFTSASGASGTSGAIYKWLGLTGSFPDDVVLAMSKVCDAKHHCYSGDKHVIHVVGPDFREGIWSEREATIELSRAYRNALHEFVMSECSTLRMVPISSGEKSGALYNQMPLITYQALVLAFEQLHVFDKEYVLRDESNLQLCIFMNREWDMYKNAFDTLKPTNLR